jgi:hypothetical protein
MGPIFGEWDGSETAGAASGQDAQTGERRMNALVPGRACLTLSN